MVVTQRISRLFLLTLLLVAPNVAAKVYDPVTATLSNGLQIIVVPNHRAPVVHHMLWYRVGSVDEVEEKSGLAHYLEHLMFKGTATVPPGGYSKAIAAVGGRENAFTSHYFTAYFATVPADFLPQLMELEADRMHNLAITEEQAMPERDVVLAERRQRTDDEPGGRFAEKMNKAIYGTHPLGRPVIGWRDDIIGLSVEDAEDFYRQWYAPNNAILIVSGDVTPEKVLQIAAATYGRVESQPLPLRPETRTLYVPHKEPESLFVQDPDVRQVNIQRHYIAPSYQTATGYTPYALQVLAEILDGGAVGRLYRKLVMEKKIATETGADYDALSRDDGSFSIGLTLPPKANVGQSARALDALLADLVKRGVTESEVKRAIKRMREQAIFTRDHLMTPGYAFGQHLSLGLSVADVENWPDTIGRVTVTEVNAAARQVFGSKDYVTGYLIPDGKSPFAKVGKVTVPQGDIR